MKVQKNVTIDPIPLSVMRGLLETTRREMTLSPKKIARSNVANLANDYSTAGFTYRPEIMLHRHDSPLYLEPLIPKMNVAGEYFKDDIHDSDFQVQNDPAQGDSPAIDTCFYKPVFWKGTLKYWADWNAHLTDIGAPLPAGDYPNATKIDAECLRMLRSEVRP